MLAVGSDRSSRSANHRPSGSTLSRALNIHYSSFWLGSSALSQLSKHTSQVRLSKGILFVSVPNKAFQGSTWVNDKRHTWKQWKYGHSSLAVDGKESTNLPNCAIMDNYYVDKPVFMVDLGARNTVNGIVIITWQGQGQGKAEDSLKVYIYFETFSDKITSYTDYVYNLDRLSVYVSDKKELNYTGLSSQQKCGVITRKNTALFNPRLHFDCPEPLKGRYVYVKATGVPNRWRKLFNVVLCEVQVY